MFDLALLLLATGGFGAALLTLSSAVSDEKAEEIWDSMNDKLESFFEDED